MLATAFAMVAVMETTGNGAVVPAALFYGAAAGPVAFLVATNDRTGLGHSVRPGTLLGMFLFGGGVGLIFAAFFDVVLSSWEWVGFVEETAKLLGPVGMALTGRYLSKAAGVALGLASASGFAILESMSYGLTSTLSDGIVAGEGVELIRMITTPFSHLAWTGFVCAVAFGVWAKRGRIVVTLPVIGAFLLAAVLHTANDAALGPDDAGLPSWIGLLFPLIALISYLIFHRATRDLHPADDDTPTGPMTPQDTQFPVRHPNT